MFNVIISGKPGAFTVILTDESGNRFLTIDRDSRADLIAEIEDLTTDL